MLTLRLKNGDKVTISNPDGTTTELLIRVNEGNAVKLGIRVPKEYGVKRSDNKQRPCEPSGTLHKPPKRG